MIWVNDDEWVEFSMRQRGGQLLFLRHRNGSSRWYWQGDSGPNGGAPTSAAIVANDADALVEEAA